MGEQFDHNAGFYYNRARWYSPNTGRFTSVDPFKGKVGVPLSQHRYLYANQNPINKKDPSGRVTYTEVTTTMTINTNLNITFNVAVRTGAASLSKWLLVKQVLGGVAVTGLLAQAGWDVYKQQQWLSKANKEVPLRLQHYTTEDGKKGIEGNLGVLDPKRTRDGVIYFSPDIYYSSTEATEDLAVDPEREWYISLNMYFDADAMSGPRPVAKKTYKRDDGTEVTRRGGGTEYWTSEIIPTSELLTPSNGKELAEPCNLS